MRRCLYDLDESGVRGERFPPLFLQSIFPHVIGLKSAFEVVLSPVMQKPDMEHQASLLHCISKVGAMSRADASKLRLKYKAFARLIRLSG